MTKEQVNDIYTKLTTVGSIAEKGPPTSANYDVIRYYGNNIIKACNDFLEK